MEKRLIVLMLVLAVALVGITGCDKSSSEPEAVNEFDLVSAVGDQYYTNYTTASGEGVNVRITAVFDILTDGDTSNDPFIIDCRQPADYNDKHIIGAVNITPGNLVSKIEDGTIPKDRKILNVCYTGQSASAATALLNMLGYEAQNLLFGMCGVDTSISGSDKWVKQIATDERAGQMVSDESVATETYDFPTLNTGEATAEEIMKARFSSYIGSGWGAISANDVWDNPDDYFIINYWPADKYINPGHIPGAYQFTPKSSLKTTEKLNLLPTDKKVVVYCYTGQTSAQVVTYLKILGYDAYSLLYGVNGFDTNATSKYSVPTGDYSAILE
ncbi:hypothetical protein GF337_02965 [candidate division KSB1 bacterium]|nr:hypothetical protein [candidate division KSB1 bacterium]